GGGAAGGRGGGRGGAGGGGGGRPAAGQDGAKEVVGGGGRHPPQEGDPVPALVRDAEGEGQLEGDEPGVERPGAGQLGQGGGVLPHLRVAGALLPGGLRAVVRPSGDLEHPLAAAAVPTPGPPDQPPPGPPPPPRPPRPAA